MAKETIHCLLTVEILKLHFTSPNGNIWTMADFNNFNNFSMKTALNPDEVIDFFKTFLFAVQYMSFDGTHGWHITLVDEFMRKYNLVFTGKDDCKGNSLRNLCIQGKTQLLKTRI
eukprot:11416725-Ditylum_brightwellii.AAC.1